MSTDPTFSVEWTVPADEWGEAAHDDRPADGSTRDIAHSTPSDRTGTVTADSDRDDSASQSRTASYASRDPENLPPAPVLAAHVDALRADRDARERQLDAVRERYETIIDERNAEIESLRARQDASLLERLRNLF